MALSKTEERKRNKAGKTASKLGGGRAPKNKQTEGTGGSSGRGKPAQTVLGAGQRNSAGAAFEITLPDDILWRVRSAS